MSRQEAIKILVMGGRRVGKSGAFPSLQPISLSFLLDSMKLVEADDLSQAAVAVRFLTGRFIGDYSSLKGDPRDIYLLLPPRSLQLSSRHSDHLYERNVATVAERVDVEVMDVAGDWLSKVLLVRGAA